MHSAVLDNLEKSLRHSPVQTETTRIDDHSSGVGRTRRDHAVGLRPRRKLLTTRVDTAQLEEPVVIAQWWSTEAKSLDDHRRA